MGDRGVVHIKDESVYLYTHWDASKLIKTVKSALSKKWRWDDPVYLSRIIFDEMIGENQGTETGFGITGKNILDEWRMIEIDCSLENITIRDHGKTVVNKSFAEFISH